MTDFDNVIVNDYLDMKATDQANYVRLKAYMFTIPSTNPILKIGQGMLAFKDLQCLGFLASVSKTEIPLSSTGYINCVPSDIGKQVRDDGVTIPDLVLADYDNIGSPPLYTKRWWLSGSTSVASGSAMTIVNGTGGGTSSAASSVYGGGAIRIGHGLTGATDPPKISLMDSAQGYDTLYLRMKDGTTPAKLNLGKLEIQSTNNKFAVTAGDNGANQDTYLIPQNPSQGGLGLGTATYPFKWVDATNLYCNTINLLSGSYISIVAPLKITGTFMTSTSSYGYLNSSGGHGYISGNSGNVWVSLQTSGRIFCGGEIDCTSDQRDKYLVDTLNSTVALEAVKNLTPLHFTWKPQTNKGKSTLAGFYAQEVAKVIPEAVTVYQTERYTDEHTLNYNVLLAYATSAVQELLKRIEALENQLKQNQTAD